MKIWLICQYYKPEPGAPSARLSGLARIWAGEGHNVTVLTAVPNHPRGIVPPEYREKPSFLKEDIDGIPVWRHWLYVTPNEGFAKKVMSHLSFAATVLFTNLRHKAIDCPDVIVASSPSFFAVFSAWILAKRYGVPFVIEVRDLWPGIFVELGVMKPGFVLNTLEKLELFLYRQAAAVVTVTRGFAENITERGIDASKVFVITNGVSDSEIDHGQDALVDGSVDKLRGELQINPLTKVVLYIGAHGTSQALGQVVDAARLLMSRNDILFLFVGDGADKERLKRIARGMPNVQFIPSQSKERVWHFYNLAYIGLVPLRDVPGFKSFIPSKMFEIMAAGTVGLGAVTGEAAQIMKNSGGFAVVPPEDPEKMAHAIVDLIEDPEKAQKMGESGRRYVSEKFRHSLLGRQYLGILQKVVSQGH